MDLVQKATEALQAQERFHLGLRAVRQQQSINNVYQESSTILNKLRDIKSELEHTAVNFESVTVNNTVLQEIKTHVLMHVPGTFTPEVRDKLQTLVKKAFDGTCKKVIFGALMTCPWYWSTQDERGLQAKHNTLFVVYQSKDEQLLSPVNPHIKEKDSEVIDEGWFYAAEAYHFAHYLLKGKSRFVETLFMTDEVVFLADDEWRSLKTHFESKSCLGLRGFLEQCRGQAVGTVAKKSKSTGRMKLKDGAILYEFCEGFRLLHYASLSLSSQLLHLGSLKDIKLDEIASQAAQQLKAEYQADMCDKLKLFEILMSWRGEIDNLMKGYKFTNPDTLEKRLGEWLVTIRTQGQEVPKPPCVPDHKKECLQKLMTEIGGPVLKMNPENIVMIAQAGSVIYGLNTPESDVDYIIIYAEPIKNVLSTCKRLTESCENRGPTKSFEYGTYEARLFCEMLWKASVVMLELLFADSINYTSAAWETLVANKNLFLTERAILQYFGLIKNNMNDIEHQRYIGTGRERKLFYQIFHKLYCMEYFLKGECPQIKCQGPTKDYIMRIRKGPLQDDISRENLYEECQQKIDRLQKRLSERTERLPENISYDFLTKWLMDVRGWTKESNPVMCNDNIDETIRTDS